MAARINQESSLKSICRGMSWMHEFHAGLLLSTTEESIIPFFKMKTSAFEFLLRLHWNSKYGKLKLCGYFLQQWWWFEDFWHSLLYNKAYHDVIAGWCVVNCYVFKSTVWNKGDTALAIKCLLGLCSLNGRTFHCKISRSLGAARFVVRLFKSRWNLKGTSTAVLPRSLSNFRAIRSSWQPISWLRDFTIFGGKMSVRLVNRDPDLYQPAYHVSLQKKKLHFIFELVPF